MKKIVLVAAIASLSLVSCKKDYTCECSSSTSGITFTLKTEAKSSKKSAEEWCKGLQNSTATATVNGVSSGSSGDIGTCSIK